MRTARVIATSASLILLFSGAWLACGGDDSTDGGGGTDGGVDGTVDTGSGVDTGGGGNDTGTNDTGTTDTGTGDTGTGDGGAGDAATDAPIDSQLIQDSGGAVTDAGPGGDATALSCGSAQCQLPTQTCCVYTILNPPPPFYVSCATGAACPSLSADAGYDATAAVALQCESEQNCGGGLRCCMTSTNDGGTIAAHCANACSGGEQNAFLCDPAAADAGCGDAGTCSTANIGTWRLPSGFATCGGKAR